MHDHSRPMHILVDGGWFVSALPFAHLPICPSNSFPKFIHFWEYHFFVVYLQRPNKLPTENPASMLIFMKIAVCNRKYVPIRIIWFRFYGLTFTMWLYNFLCTCRFSAHILFVNKFYFYWSCCSNFPSRARSNAKYEIIIAFGKLSCHIFGHTHTHK